jgi:succinyl-diaminopimelate desuccinylase
MEHWDSGPFAGEIKDGFLTGRGAVDMKGAIAAWIAAVSRLPHDLPITLSFLITGDEEGDALNGTTKVVDWLRARSEVIDHCVVGEPTAVAQLGDMIKVGRRGSINTTFVVTGKQGHVAYPHRALNPAPIVVDLMQRLKAKVLDEGFERFQPSNLEITTIDIGNRATNVIAQTASARTNIRFNPNHKGADLAQWMIDEAALLARETGAQIEVKPMISGEAFLTQSHEFIDLITTTIQTQLGVTCEASTSGGTSDARFIRHLCPVVEFGLVGQTMHMVNECVAVDDLVGLSASYEALILAYSAKFG